MIQSPSLSMTASGWPATVAGGSTACCTAQPPRNPAAQIPGVEPVVWKATSRAFPDASIETWFARSGRVSRKVVVQELPVRIA